MFDMFDINVIVVDDNGVPVENSNAYIGFDKNTSSGTKMSAIKGKTDSGGKFNASGSGNGHIAYGAKKDGYYNSHYTYDFAFYENKKINYPIKKDFVILLRKIENPVPMYVRDTRMSKIVIPESGKDIGFDLIKFDWVVPYGTGNQSDFIFHLERLPVVSRKNYEATLTITFVNKNDGIQKYKEDLKYGSQFKMPRYAPEVGYESKLVLYESFGVDKPTKYNFNFRADDLNYIFRVRSQEKEGKIERAMYGKILKYISFTAMDSKTAEIYLRYYINPDHTRNLEFNPKRNLFGNLPDSERITEP
jgi:hypothetical protein